MASTPTKTSARLTRAAQAELAALERAQENLQRRREALRSEIEELDQQLGAVDDQIALVRRLAGVEHGVSDASCAIGSVLAHELAISRVGANQTADDREVLKGPAIRETAVRLLVERHMTGRPLHYRQWHALIEEAGYAVAGKDPAAVFLSQVSRSPVVRRTTESGIYVVDPEAVDHLRRRLANLQRELSDLARTPADAADMAAQRERREQLMSEISQAERGLEESLRVLAPQSSSAPHLAAAG